MIELFRVSKIDKEMMRGFVTEFNGITKEKSLTTLNCTSNTVILDLVNTIDNNNTKIGFLYGEFVNIASNENIYTFNVYGFYIKPEYRRQGYGNRMLDLLLGYMNAYSDIKPCDIKIQVHENALDMKILLYRYGFNHIDNTEKNIIFTYPRLRDILRYSLEVLSNISDLSGIYADRLESHLLKRELGAAIQGESFAIGTMVNGKQITLLGTVDLMNSHDANVVDFLNQAMIDRLRNYITGL